MLAQQETNCDKKDPNYNPTDGRIYKRILPSDDSSDDQEDRMTNLMKLPAGSFLENMENMNNFVSSK